MKIAFLGLGLMGGRMAQRLVAAGHDLTVWNRSLVKADPLVAAGAQLAASPAAAVASAELIILMLENGEIVHEILFGTGNAACAIPSDAVLIDMSSIRPTEAQDHAARMSKRGVRTLDAPVSGGTTAATDGNLAIMVGGDPGAFELAEPVLRALGRPTLVGPAGSGQLAKLANQIIVGVTIGAVAEALLLASRGGADPTKVREALRGGFAESRILELHGSRMLDRDFATRGRSVTHLKDLDNALDAGKKFALTSLPYTSLSTDLLRSLIAADGDLDHSALLLELERRNPISNDLDNAS